MSEERVSGVERRRIWRVRKVDFWEERRVDGSELFGMLDNMVLVVVEFCFVVLKSSL